MFGPSKTSLVAALLAEKTANAELRARVAQLTANFDWLASHVNELKIERAALLDRCIDIRLAGVPVIQREVASLPGADPNYQPQVNALPNVGDVLAKARDLVEDSKRPRAEQDGSLAAADLQAISFEDMGDEAARRAGVGHDPAGRLVYAGSD